MSRILCRGPFDIYVQYGLTSLENVTEEWFERWPELRNKF
jgi:hypothetical protein